MMALRPAVSSGGRLPDPPTKDENRVVVDKAS